jgi:hypothetical protein
MGASARDAHVFSPRSITTRSGFNCRRARIGATLYSPGTLSFYMRGPLARIRQCCDAGSGPIVRSVVKNMFQKYKEIIFGIGFGIAALIIDTVMDAKAAGNSFADEAAAHPGMMVYRLGFVLLGLAFGWLLWKNRTRERQCQLVSEALHNLQEKCAAQALLLRAALQLLLTRNDFHLPDEAQKLVRDAYERAQELQRLGEEKSPS